MIFNSASFLLFFAVVLLLYYLVPKKLQWGLLLAASYFFYLYASVKFAVFILFTTTTAYFAANAIGKIQQEMKKTLRERKEEFTRETKKKYKESCKKRQKRILTGTLVSNFGILVFLKFYNFAAINLTAVFALTGSEISIPTMRLILPLGISFYTFQTMGYLIDVYWEKVQPEKSYLKTALFVSYFPQIIEGPISRFGELAPQLFEKKSFDYHRFSTGIQLMIWGFFKKMVIADRFSVIANTVFDNFVDCTGFQVALGIFFYAIQDYTDFSGCIDIARGASEAMGITLAENFDHPYFSRTIPEYWRRWHATLGSWFKDYVFYPISISQCSIKLGKFSKKHFGKQMGKNVPAFFGLAVTWLTTGLWHGSDWNYIGWGVYYGLLIILGILFEPLFQKLNRLLKLKTDHPAWIVVQVLRTFLLTCVGRLIFRANHLSDAAVMMKKMKDLVHLKDYYYPDLWNLGLDHADYMVAFLVLAALFIISFIQEKYHLVIREKLYQLPMLLRWLVLFVGVQMILIFGMYGEGFSQAAFVYMQF